jgi:hypothetical protein
MTNTSSPQTHKGRYFAYLRVSTPKQGEGVSLLTQREAIATFAGKRTFLIVDWFEEKETAAKRGRPVFGKVLATRLITATATGNKVAAGFPCVASLLRTSAAREVRS